MVIRKIPRENLFGIFYVRKPDGAKWVSYYKTLEALRPLFKSEEFKAKVKGFYLNVCGDFDSVRISYFVDKEQIEQSKAIFGQFFSNNGIVEIRDSSHPKEIILARNYGGDELEERFRNFLVLETQIGLELIKADLLHARSLFATYRLQVCKGRLSVREHFEPTFRRHSPTYVTLSNEEKEQFLTDLENHPGWMHMMVNFVFGLDFLRVYPDGMPLSIPKINEILEVKNLGFQIPLGWKSTP